MIKNLVFDLGAVLIDWNPRYLYKKLAPNDDQKIEDFLANVCTHDWNRERDGGATFEEGIAERIKKFRDDRQWIEAYYQRWAEMLGGEIAESVALLAELKKLPGLRIFSITNWSAQTFPIARKLFPFLSWFEGIIVSGEEKLLKPDPQIYQLVLSRFDLKANECVFIDDIAANVAGAEEVGMQGIVFEDPNGLRLALKEMGIAV